jgi:hypothetical protein
MVKMNKRGFLRIAEAGIAIMIILTAILINIKDLKSLKEPDYSETARDILKEVANDESLRTEIINAGSYTPNVESFVDGRLPDYLKFELRGCDINNVCGQSSYQGDVYSGERIISAYTDIYSIGNNPSVKLRLFIWEEGR